MSSTSEERLKRAQEYIEMIIDSKLDSWRITRNDLKTIIERLDIIRTMNSSIAENLSNIRKEQDLIKSALERLSLEQGQRNQILISEFSKSVENFANVCRDIKEVVLRIHTQEVESSRKLESIQSIIEALRGENKELLVQLRKDVSGLQAELSKVTKNITGVIQNQQEIDKNLSELIKKVSSVGSDTKQSIDRLCRRIDSLKGWLKDNIGGIPGTQAVIGRLEARIIELHSRLDVAIKNQEELLRRIEMLSQREEALNKIFGEVNNLLVNVLKGLAMLNEISNRIGSLMSGIERVYRKIEAIEEKVEIFGRK